VDFLLHKGTSTRPVLPENRIFLRQPTYKSQVPSPIFHIDWRKAGNIREKKRTARNFMCSVGKSCLWRYFFFHTCLILSL